MKKIFLSVSLFFMIINIFAQLTIAPIFTNNMVLQQKKVNKIWGTATAKSVVTVSFKLKNYNAIVNDQGYWFVNLPPCKAGIGGNIIVTSNNEVVKIKNILVGEVWLCSGQSNMELTINYFKDVYADEIKNANNDYIRFAVIERKFDSKENKNARLSKAWNGIASSTIGDCSAVAYFYAKKLYEKLKVPIGLINVAWSGTPAQAWVDANTLKLFPTHNNFYIKNIAPIDFATIENLRQIKADKYNKIVKNAATYFREMAQPNFDDSQWEKTTLPKLWEDNGHPNLDGIVAYRIEFNLTKGNENKTAVLHLPAIDDEDTTYVNGTFIGTKYSWNEKRLYNIPANILKEGKNVIAIWVNDTGGGGGLDNDSTNFYVAIGDKKIDLKGKATLKILAQQEPVVENINYADIQDQPSVLFNGMIAPLLDLSFKGVIWYQGESNAYKYEEYKTLFPSLIKNWRNRFSQADFPFLFVQLAAYNPTKVEPIISDWALLREAQMEALKLPNTAMAVTYDIGDQLDIHPKKKKEVGDRLAVNALKMLYGFNNEIATGPTVGAISFPLNNTVAIVFNNIAGGLKQHGEKLLGFYVAGADKIFKEATSTIINNNTVVVSNAQIQKPLYVRYAWANAPLQANLFNSKGLPALPFRTDN